MPFSVPVFSSKGKQVKNTLLGSSSKTSVRGDTGSTGGFNALSSAMRDPNLVGSYNQITEFDGTEMSGGGGGTASGISAGKARAAAKIGNTQNLAGKSVDEALQGARKSKKLRKLPGSL